MRSIWTIIFLLLPLLCISQTTIKGKIRNYDGKSIISYYTTLEGIMTSYWEEVQPSAIGTFKIRIDNRGFGTTSLIFNKINYRFFHDTNSEIYFEIDQDKMNFPNRFHGFSGGNTDGYLILDSIRRVSTLLINGDFSVVNNFYNQLPRTANISVNSVDGNYYSWQIFDASDPQKARFIINSLVNNEVDEINKLNISLNLEDVDHTDIADEIREFLINEVYAYYGNIFINGMFLKRREQMTRLFRDSTAALDIYNPQWEHLIEEFSKEMQALKPIPNSLDYNWFVNQQAVAMKNYKEYTFSEMRQSLDDTVIEGLLGGDSILFNDSGTQLAYRFMHLQMYLNDQLFYSPALLDAVYELQRRYPESAHFKHFEPHIEKLKAYIIAGSKDFDKSVIIKKHYTSFGDLLEQFRGQNLLIDVWATWCHPCVEEFKYKEKIKPFIDSNQIQVLYISIDKPQWEDRWRQSIKYNQLEGFHVRGNNEFIIDMWNVLGGYKGAIPRYALVDTQGEIFISTAASPGEDDELVKQIHSLLEANKEK